jgi:S-disulfanyl-L-cysteine oxidoreductase SoxD
MKAHLALPALLVTLLAAQAPLQSSSTVLDGVFSEAQAKRGEAAYTTRCADCHEGADVDGPALEGMPFIDRWREDSLTSLFTFLKASMPADKPGDLSDETYVDVIAYLLKMNTYPAGAKELTVAMLATTRLVGKDGPKPLPTNAVVQVVGCLTRDADGSWTLKSGEVSRTMAGDRITAEEQKAASAKALGSEPYRLQNLADIPGFIPESHLGKKLLTKGVLVHQGDRDRINVTAVSDLGSSCGN